MELDHANQLWVSDITYVKVRKQFQYLWLITDAYSRKVVGYKLSKTMETEHGIEALRMAINSLTEPVAELIHHSDRGLQYCSEMYTGLLKENGIRISMTQNGDPLENAIAERINGVIKQEFLDCIEFQKMSIGRRVRQGIERYNSQRPHRSTGMLTPNQAHKKTGPLKRTWKNYYKAPVNQYQE